MHRAVQAVQSDIHNLALPVVNKLVVAMVATPRAGFGEVVVHMRCRPVQPADLLCASGIYPPWQPPCFPATLGVEGMGTIHEVRIYCYYKRCGVLFSKVEHDMSDVMIKAD